MTEMKTLTLNGVKYEIVDAKELYHSPVPLHKKPFLLKSPCLAYILVHK